MELLNKVNFRGMGEEDIVRLGIDMSDFKSESGQGLDCLFADGQPASEKSMLFSLADP